MTAKIKLNAASGGGSVSLQAPTSTTGNANVEFKLPVADGTSGQALTTNASGQLAFATVSDGIPTGVIVMWSGSVATIPSGFVLCDGNNSTPDLRDRFIVGAKQDDSGTAKTNILGSLTQTGGSTTDSISFTASTGHEIVTTNASSAYNGAQGGSRDRHTHTVSASMTVDIIPPFYALAFIMKT